MPADVAEMRNLMLPGLLGAAQRDYAVMREVWDGVFTTDALLLKGWERYSFHTSGALPSGLSAPVSLPVAIGMGIAAAVVTNPPVSRRGLLGGLFGLPKRAEA